MPNATLTLLSKHRWYYFSAEEEYLICPAQQSHCLPLQKRESPLFEQEKAPYQFGGIKKD